ncbi:MAG: cell division protein FtsW [Calditrichaeota bacterium]|nr:cell division protein FtsW [Calditrichota bacterium]MCB9368508.1 cell division protein FtsW [Calditrichota bacterium]
MNRQQTSAYSPFGQGKSPLDIPLIGAVMMLCIAGVVFVFTSSAAHSWQTTNGDSITFLTNHLQRLAAGIVVLVFFYHFRYQLIEKLARPVLLAAFVGLIAVLILPKLPGTTAKRWIVLFGLSIQPAELAKYALIAYLSKRLSEIDDSSFPADRKRKLYALLGLVILTLGLIIIEPNLSMVILISGVTMTLLLLHGLEWKKILLLLPIGGLGVGGILMIKPYMVERIDAFVKGISDPLHASYHIRQSLIAIGQGGVTGLGLGQSTQKHYYLPEPYNDSIFSIIGEETGLIGALLLLSAFLVVIVRGWKIAMNAQDRFSYYLAAGITSSLACSMIVNIGVNLALLPATGQPLPFVSYGGTSLVMSMAAVGVLMNIAKQQNTSTAWKGAARPLSL